MDWRTTQMRMIAENMTRQELVDFTTVIKYMAETGHGWPTAVLELAPPGLNSQWLHLLASVLRMDRATVVLGALVVLLCVALVLF